MQPWTTRHIPAALNPGAARYRGDACARAANGPRVSAGIRADENAASPSRTRCVQWLAAQAVRRAEKPASHRSRDAFAYRCGGSTGWRAATRRRSLFPV
ncbi:hypothetical protein Y033_5954 [Burkholderia pseudomallei MSHR435]|nr:hypothetical protein Y033_5954 [Burkholderia pseudomallei MSHR435]